MRIKKQTPAKPVNRFIPEADVRNFSTPDLGGIKPLHNSDITLLRSLSTELRVTGVIDREATVTESQTLIELNSIFSEAAEHQKYEKDINPAFFDSEADAFLEDRQLTEGDLFENPSFDGVDDYGAQVYDRFVETEENEKSLADTLLGTLGTEKVSETSGRNTAFRLPDGKIDYGK
jgi:hypothetical protein